MVERRPSPSHALVRELQQEVDQRGLGVLLLCFGERRRARDRVNSAQGLVLDVQVRNEEVPVRRVGDREVAASEVEVELLT